MGNQGFISGLNMSVFKNVCRRQRRTYLLVGREDEAIDYQGLRCSIVEVGTVYRNSILKLIQYVQAAPSFAARAGGCPPHRYG